MLNWAARYYPIVRVLKAHGLFQNASMLEIGSGAIGIGRFRKVPFVGCDLSFAHQPEWPMTAITASAAQLPMKDKQFDVILASDVLEHIPPQLRQTVIQESMRVAGKLVIFAFPSGQLAWDSDKALVEVYRNALQEPPEWLTEHMDAPFPGDELFQTFDGWKIEKFGNENIRFHSWLMQRERSYYFVRITMLAMQYLPRLVEWCLRRTDRAPFYRQIFVLSRNS